jgi:hypothetical protein
MYGRDQCFMAFPGAVIITRSPLPSHHSQFSKVVPILKHHTLKAHGGVDIHLRAFLTWVQDDGKYLRFIPDIH